MTVLTVTASIKIKKIKIKNNNTWNAQLKLVKSDIKYLANITKKYECYSTYTTILIVMNI